MRLASATLGTLLFIIIFASFGQKAPQAHQAARESEGPNPYHEITQYGGRAIDRPITSTATINTSSPATVLLSSTPALRNGDGVRISGAGAANTLSAPTAPTVTPMQASGPLGSHRTVDSPAGGDTTFCYEIVARDRNGGLTEAGSSGCTSKGYTLGATAVKVTSLSRSRNTVTAVTAAQSFAKGAVVWDTQSTDASFSGFYVLASTTGTGFTYTQPTSTLNGATTSATGGKAQVFFGNKVKWTAVPNAYQYYVYKLVSRTYRLIGATKAFEQGEQTETEWDDFGQSAPPLPDFVPTTSPSSATNDYLSTTITAGGGTDHLTIANAAKNAVKGALIEFDDGPALSACIAAAGGTNSCHIATNSTGASFVINSHRVFSQPAGVSILQSGPVTLNETVEMTTGDTDWEGSFAYYHNAPQFSWITAPPLIVGTAYPGLSFFGNQSSFKKLSMSAPNQGLVMQINGAFQTKFEMDNCSIGTSGDFMGMCIWGYGAGLQKFDYVNFIDSGVPAVGNSLAPILYYTNDINKTSPSSYITCTKCFFTIRGMALNDDNVGVNGTITIDDSYAQELATPALMLTTSNGGVFVDINNFGNDTSFAPVLAVWWPNNVSARMYNVQSGSAETPGGVPPFISGYMLRALEVGLYAGIPGQTLQAEIHPENSAASNQALIAPGMTTSGQLNQLYTGNIGGTCKMSAGTTCTVRLAAPFKGTPICIAMLQGTGTVIAAECSITGTTATVTAASSNSGTWGVFFFGNLN